MIVKIFSVFCIWTMTFMVSMANDTTSVDVETTVHTLVAKIKDATPAQKRLLLDALKVKLRASQKKIRRQVMIKFRNEETLKHKKVISKPQIEQGVKFD